MGSLSGLEGKEGRDEGDGGGKWEAIRLKSDRRVLVRPERMLDHPVLLSVRFRVGGEEGATFGKATRRV